MSVIMPCKCKHKDQDKMNGPGNRVFNEMGDDKNARCTVCGQVKKYRDAPGVKEKKK